MVGATSIVVIMIYDAGLPGLYPYFMA